MQYNKNMKQTLLIFCILVLLWLTLYSLIWTVLNYIFEWAILISDKV